MFAVSVSIPVSLGGTGAHAHHDVNRQKLTQLACKQVIPKMSIYEHGGCQYIHVSSMFHMLNDS